MTLFGFALVLIKNIRTERNLVCKIVYTLIFAHSFLVYVRQKVLSFTIMSFEDQIISVLLHYSLDINRNAGRQKKKSEKRFTLIM